MAYSRWCANARPQRFQPDAELDPRTEVGGHLRCAMLGSCRGLGEGWCKSDEHRECADCECLCHGKGAR